MTWKKACAIAWAIGAGLGTFIGIMMLILAVTVLAIASGGLYGGASCAVLPWLLIWIFIALGLALMAADRAYHT